MPSPLLIAGGAALILYSMKGDKKGAEARPDPKATEPDTSDVDPGFNFAADGTGRTFRDPETGVSYTEHVFEDGSKVLYNDAGEVVMRDGEIKPMGRVKPQSTKACDTKDCPGPVSERMVSKRVEDAIYANILDVVI